MFDLPKLPYAEDALAPHMSARTLAFHHGKHHQKYIDTTNALIKGTPLAEASLQHIIQKSHGSNRELFNNAGQVYSHNLFWQCMTPSGGGAVPGKLEQRLAARYGSVDAFKKDFVKLGVGQFGSGWVWLVVKDDSLDTMATADADTPLTQGAMPLIVCDVWEHAYYLDYQDRRADFLRSFLNHLANWEFAAARLAAAF